MNALPTLTGPGTVPLMRTLALLSSLTLALAACGEVPKKNAPPAGPGHSHVPETEPEDEDLCVLFEDCAVDCGEIEFGDEEMTRAEQEWCLSWCERPALSDETLDSWGEACLTGDDELCEEGATLCSSNR